MILELIVVLAAIIIGARLGGIGLGVMGGMGLAVLVFGFGMAPGKIPIDVMLMIAAVISAAAAMQAAGGLDYLVHLAEKLLRKNPSRITILSPLVTYFFTFIAGTGHIAYSVLPVIAEVARETKIRPERPLGIAVIASQQAITASPISAATAAFLGLLIAFNPSITLLNILMVSIPATLIGVLVGAIMSRKVGKELEDDPEYQRRIKEGMLAAEEGKSVKIKNLRNAKLSVIFFILATALIVVFGSVKSIQPVFDGTPIKMEHIIEILMLTASAIILLLTKTNGIEVTKGNVFIAGMQAMIAIFGIAWMGDTFIAGNMDILRGSIEGLVKNMPWIFGVALFVMSILLYSQAATVSAIMPLGIALGLSPWVLIALYPAVNGYFFIPNYPTIVAAINFDRTGTTHIGKYILNHSFMRPGLIASIVGVAAGFALIEIYKGINLF
ncbi:MAG: anaerobic C4-dicarboxylate transporter [Muribaculaceae bacterium]|nr:anaerobic C4-dicarboxylate transporter [Muribaculaceae bacterium]